MAKTAQKRFKSNLKNCEATQFSKDYQPSPQAKSNGWKKALTLRAITNMVGMGAPAEKVVAEYKKVFPNIDEKQMTQDVALIMGQYHKGVIDRDTTAARFIAELKGATKNTTEIVAPIQIVFEERFKKL